MKDTDRHIQNILDDVRTGKYEEENEHDRVHLKKAKGNYDNFMREREKIIRERENVSFELNQAKEKIIKEELEEEKVERANIKRRNEEKLQKP